MTGKPRHSESNGGIERRNRTVEEKIKNWMHENQSTHWAQLLPFIQWRCNTQIHRGIGRRTPYHLMFGQHPQVGISTLPISHNLLTNLATEMDVNRCLGLPRDVPLEQAKMSEALTHSQTDTNRHAVALSSNQLTVSQSTEHSTKVLSVVPFHSDGFTSDKTELLVARLHELGTIWSKKYGTYFYWKMLGFQCGVCFNALPSHVSFNMQHYLMNIDTKERNDRFFEELPDEALPDELPAETRKHPPENLNEAFLPSLLKDKSKYESDVRYPWLSLLMKVEAVTDPCVLKKATIRTSFSILDKESSINEQWRRVILRKFQKDAWEVLDEYGDSVLDTVLQTGEKGVANQWGKWFRAPTLDN